MAYNRLADIFLDLESTLIQNQRSTLLSMPNGNMTEVEKFQLAMRSRQSLLERSNLEATVKAYNLAIDNLSTTIGKGYNTGIKNLETQLDKKIDNNSNSNREQLEENARQAISRMCNIAFSTSVMAFSSIVSSLTAYNYAQNIYTAVDLAQVSTLDKGVVGSLNTNGASVNISTFADIIEGEYEHRAILTGEGHARDESDNHLVIVSEHFGCCDKCRKWECRTLIDDVYSKGVPDGEHELLSTAMAEGLFHPNCRHRTYVALRGQNKPKEWQNWTYKQNKEQYQATQRQRQIERNIRQYKRREEGMLTESERENAHRKVLEWQKIQRDHINSSNSKDGIRLFREYKRERVDGETKPQRSLEYPITNLKDKYQEINGTKITAEYKYDKETLSEDIKATEKYIAELPNEHAFVFTRGGKVYGFEGNEQAVDPTPFIEEELNGAIVTHNHPFDELAPSREDIQFMANNNIKELRTVDKNNLYILRLENNISKEDFLKSYEDAVRKVMEKPAFEFNESFEVMVLEELNKTKGVDYARYKR